MILRPFSILLSAVVGVAVTVMAGPTAHADSVTCTITGTSPEVIAAGIGPQRVQFGVRTDCDGKYPVSWNLSSDIYPGSTGASWLLLRNYDYPYGEKFSYVEDPQGYFTLNFVGTGRFQGNQVVGSHPLRARAFHDADADGVMDSDEIVTEYTGSVRVKRHSTFGDSFTATGPGRRGHGHGPVRFTASLQRANWDSGQYDNFAAWVQLQFRPAGANRYRPVKWVWDDGVSATTRVRPTRTGTWRYHYAGGDISGASNTQGITVVVPSK